MPGYGYQNFIGAAVETVAWGTKVTPTTKFLELVAGGDRLGSTQELITSAGMNEISIHKTRKVRRGKLIAGGEFEFEIPYQGAETFFKFAFGKVVSTIIGGGPAYTHVFTLTPSATDGWLSLMGLTLESRVEHDTGTNSFFYEGSFITRTRFSVGQDGYWRCVMGVVAEDESAGSPSTATLPPAPLANYYDDTAGGQLTFNSAGYEVTDFEVNLDLGLNVDRRSIGSRLIKKPTPGGPYNVSGRFTAMFENLNAYNDFRAATERALVIKSVGDLVPSSSSNYSLQLDVPVAVLTPTGRPQPRDRGIIYGEYPFQGFYDGTNRELKLTLVNALTSV